jgi:septum formation protein
MAGQLVLASRSPRRVDLLRRFLDEHGVPGPFEVDPADVDETPRAGESPRDLVLRLAGDKAAVVAARHPDAVVIGADTTVDVDGESLGQPIDMEEAASMLRRLSGRTHWVHTGVCVMASGRRAAQVASTRVTMGPLADEVLRRYLATGESLGKAGAYAIQGEGAVLVERIEGSMTAVIGLPLGTLADLLGNVAPGWKSPG